VVGLIASGNHGFKDLIFELLRAPLGADELVALKSLVNINSETITGWLRSCARQLGKGDYVTPALGMLAAGSIIGLRALGGMQSWELQWFDAMMRLRPAETPDSRVVIVSLTEADIETFNATTVPDATLAAVIETIHQQSARVIGLDLYRNVPYDQGFTRLEQVFRNTPNLIGIEKVVDDAGLSAVAGNQVLVEAGRTAASDLMVDIDGRVRRGFIVPNADSERVLEGLGWRLAYEYLAQQGIFPEANPNVLTLDGMGLPPLEDYSGGYANTDSKGYQVLINWRANSEPFETVSMTQVLNGDFPKDFFRDRVVLIGSMRSGDADVVFTAYGNQSNQNLLPTHEIEIHASIVGQILSTVLDKRPQIRTLSEPLEMFLIVACTGLGGCIYLLSKTDLRRFSLTFLGVAVIVAGSYGLLLLGWWLPTVPCLMMLITTPLALRLQKINQLQSLSSTDELTQLANRRVFKEQLEKEWHRALRSQHPISLIISDVDYFKLYNDTYGHPQGDECLRQVARAMTKAIKRPGDLVARYGGEEFVILLPETDADGALKIAQTAAANVENLKLEHKASQVSESVTISLGVTSVIPSEDLSLNLLVDTADLGLYEAKRKGRNQTVLRLPWSFG
jgi:adenylate cyclase